jgi:hypothetical protein
MPARNEIQAEINLLRTTSQDLIRRRYLQSLQAKTGHDTVIYATAFTSSKIGQIPPYLLQITGEDIQGFMAALHGLKGDKLDLLLHSSGGSLEAAEQVVQYLRAKYSYIRAIVPQNAMSAATMIACACDEIVMGKQSALGPIDPQITFPTKDGFRTAPAFDLLAEFAQAKAEVSADARVAPIWVNKIRDYPPGILNTCKRTTDLSVEKVTAWLATYMFKGESDAASKADTIAKWLGRAVEHKTHGRPINFALAGEKGLKVVALEEDQVLQDLVLSVFHATCITFEFTGCVKFIENHAGRGWFVGNQAPRQGP